MPQDVSPQNGPGQQLVTLQAPPTESATELSALVERLPVGVGVADTEGRVLSLNPAGLRFHGFASPDEMLVALEAYHGTFELSYPDGRHMPAEEWPVARALRGEYVRDYVVRLRRHGDSDERVVSYSALPVANEQAVTNERGDLSRVLFVMHDLTERVRAEEATRERERQLNLLIDTAPAAIAYCDAGCRYQFANRLYAERLGLTPADVVGKHLSDVLGRSAVEAVQPYIDEVLGGRPVEFETAVELPRLGRRVMHARYAPEADEAGGIRGFVAVVTDVTERRRAEEALSLSEARFRSISESGVIALAFFDTTGAITDANDAYLELIGYTREELEAGEIRWDQLTPEEWMPKTQAAVEEYKTTGRIEPYEKEYSRKGGERFWGLFGGRQIGDSGEGVAFVLDVTERKRAEAALRELNDTLEERVYERTRQVRKHRNRIRALSRDLALAEQEERRRIAHLLHDDLQQLLFGAQLASSMDDVERLKGILGEALTLTRTLSHELSPPFLEGEDVEDLLRWLAERKRERYGLEVEVEVGARVPVPDPAVRVLLYQLLRELLFNVAKHAGTDRARLVVERRDGHVRVVVEDEGVGFDPAELEEAEGVGLGLPSVRERLELVGGTLDVASAPGEGTRVTLTVPVDESP